MAQYKILPGSGAWLSPFDGKQYAGGSVITVPDSFEPNILWVPQDDVAKGKHSEQLAKKDENLKKRDPELWAKLHPADTSSPSAAPADAKKDDSKPPLEAKKDDAKADPKAADDKSPKSKAKP